MTESTALSPEDREWLAADYAFGLLDGEELPAAARLFATETGFQDDVRRWIARMGPLLDDVAPVEPPTDLLSAIERRIPANDDDDRTVLESRLSRWRMATLGMTAVAASLAAALLLVPAQRVPVQPPSPPVSAGHEPMVATMRGDAGKLVASRDGDRKLMVVPVDVAEAPKNATHELWMIPKDGKPRSMGVMPDGPMMMDVAPATAGMLVDGATFAVSVEPMGGSPTGQPTGAVIASGPLVAA